MTCVSTQSASSLVFLWWYVQIDWSAPATECRTQFEGTIIAHLGVRRSWCCARHSSGSGSSRRSWRQRVYLCGKLALCCDVPGQNNQSTKRTERLDFEGNQMQLASSGEDIWNPTRQLNHPNWTHEIKPVCIMKTLFGIPSYDVKKSMKSPIQVATLREHSFLFLGHFVE